MLNKSVNSGLLGLLAALSLNYSVEAQQHQHSASTPASETNTSPQQQGDQHFLKMMVHDDQKTIKKDGGFGLTEGEKSPNQSIDNPDQNQPNQRN